VTYLFYLVSSEDVIVSKFARSFFYLPKQMCVMCQEEVSTASSQSSTLSVQKFFLLKIYFAHRVAKELKIDKLS